MYPRRFSIRTKFLTVSFCALLFWLLISIFFLNAVNQFNSTKAELQEVYQFTGNINEMQSQLNQLIIASAKHDSSQAVSLLVNTSLSQIRALENQILLFTEAELFRGSSIIRISLDNLSKLFNKVNELLNQNRNTLVDFSSNLSTNQILIGEVSSELTINANNIYRESTKLNTFQLLFTLAIGLLIIATTLLLFGRYMHSGINKLLHFASRLSKGQIPEKTIISSGDEFNLIADHLNQYTDDLQNKISYLKSIGEGTDDIDYSPDPDDKLGKALSILASNLKSKDAAEIERQKEDALRNWTAEGNAQLGDIFRSEMENMTELSFNIIQKLVSYMNIEMGTIFISNDSDPEHRFLEPRATYAYDRRKYLHKEMKWGEGLPGTCALEKERIFITDVPEDYYEIVSGTGSTRPKSILLTPLKIEDDVFGVVELASLRILEDYEIEFVESIAESIASTLAAVKSNERTAELLKQSRKQADELINQDEKMKMNIEELESAREESRKNESEITGILNAMNHSSLVAEYGLNGRISKVNDKYILMMESAKDQIIGKHHSEYAQVDKYSDEYKNFWLSLRKGESHSKEEKFKLYSGKEVWLQQTFTPIINEEGKVYKILNIAIDISENKEQQSALEAQASEIERSGREMETLNQAVDTSIIKCEMDEDGIITDLNQNFSEVTGYSRKEMLGRNYRLFLKDIEKDQFEKIWTEIQKEKTYEGVMRRTKPTGEEAWLMSTFSPVKNESGEIYKIYFLALDITEKKLKYQLLEDANKEIDRLRNSMNKYENG